MNQKRERWSGRVLNSEPRGVAQFHREIRTLPEGILRLAQAEYEYQYGTSQDYERMQERGGLPARFRKGTGRTALYMGQAWYAEMVG